MFMMSDDDADVPVDEEGLPDAEDAEDEESTDEAADAFDEFGNPIEE